MITLRPYQRAALDALYRDWAEGHQRLGISSATGTGKTIMMSQLAHEHARGAAPNRRVLILVHRDELVRQTVSKLLAVDATVPIGVVKARENRASAAIVVASVQTIARPRRLAQIGTFGLVICDEAHRSMSDQWQVPLAALGTLDRDSGVRVAGFSATWSRADNRPLGRYWEKISFSLSTGWAIEQGFLVRPVGKYIRTAAEAVDLDSVKRTAGDYNDRDLSKRLSRESVRDAIVAGYLQHAADRIGVCFAPTVDTAEYFRPAFEAHGITTAGYYATTNREEAIRLNKAHAAGEVQVLFSCTRLSEGWDQPPVSAGILARPTTHQGLFIQQVGRLLRPCPEIGKTDAVVLDPTGVLFKHDLEGIVDLSTSERPRRVRDDDDLDEDDIEGSGTETDEGVLARVVGFEDVDLIRSDIMWYRTERGLPFVYARGQIGFISPMPFDHHAGARAYSFGVCHAGNFMQGRWLMVGDEHATRTAAEAWARNTDALHTSRTGRWRSLRATTVHLRQTLALGLSARTTDRQGDLYDKMAVRVGSDTLDAVQSWHP
jgi:superfamily II DNA or RNA helicase